MTIETILQQNAIFKSLSGDTLKYLVSEFKSRMLSGGEVLFSLGQPGDEMFIVMEGKIAIYMPDNNDPKTGQALRIFKAGEILGEMALIDRLPRSASARAEVDTQLATLDSVSFQKLLLDHPEVAMAVMSGLSSRVRYTTDFIGEIRQWVQRMAEGNYHAIQAPDQLQDSSLSALAADFVRMASRVREREEKLQQEVAHLRIEIDDTKRKQQVSQITESEYYINIKAKLKAMREQQDDD
jgi:CRP-like cAMP-binding protein